MANKKKIVKEPEIIYFIDNGKIVVDRAILELENSKIFLDEECSIISVPNKNCFENKNEAVKELRLRKIEKELDKKMNSNWFFRLFR